MSAVFFAFTDNFTVAPVDTDPPTLTSFTINADGVTGVATFSEPIANSDGLTLSDSTTLLNPVVAGSTITYTLGSLVRAGEVLTLDYTPGDIQDLATTPNPLAAFASVPITNNSVQTSGSMFLGSYGIAETGGSVSGWTTTDDRLTANQDSAPNQPIFAANVVTFDGVSDVVRVTGPDAELVSTETPTALGAAAGEGFPPTGLGMLSDGRYVVGNAGRATLGSAFTPSIIIMQQEAAAFDVEIPITGQYGLAAPESLQGIEVLSDDSIWFAVRRRDGTPDSGSIVHIESDGTFIASFNLGYECNGLAYKPSTSQIIVSQDNGTVQFLNETTAAVERTITLGNADPDMLWYDKERDLLWYTFGVSAIQGSLGIYDLGADEEYVPYEIDGTFAIEGLHFDRSNGELHIACDAHLHGQGDLTNRIKKFSMAEPLGRSFSQFFQGEMLSAPAADATILAIGEDNGNGPRSGGAIVPIGSTDTLRIHLTGNDSAIFDGLDLTQPAAYLWETDLPTGQVKLRVNDKLHGVAYNTSVSALGRIAGSINIGDNSVANSPANVALTAAGYTYDSAERPGINARMGVTATGTLPWLHDSVRYFLPPASTQTYDLPPFLEENDIVVVLRVSDGQLQLSDILTAGYNDAIDDASFAPGMALHWKAMGATPDTTVEIDNVSNSPGRIHGIFIFVIRGANTTTPIHAMQQATGGSGLPNASALETTAPNTLRMIIGGLDDDEILTPGAPPAGWGRYHFIGVAGGSELSVSAHISFLDAPTIGTVDPAIFTGSGTDEWSAVHLAFNPA